MNVLYLCVVEQAIEFYENIDLLNAELSQSLSGKILLLADSNTAKLCAPLLTAFKNKPTLVIPSGEEHKSLETCEKIWQFLLQNQADRQSTLICIGGGVITDLGGFAASVFLRGIHFIHIPTSFLAMIDAALGGKTGVDFNNLKNYIGTFAPAHRTYVCPNFLQTLSDVEVKNGWAEAIKHGLISDNHLFEEIVQIIQNQFKIPSLALIRQICGVKQHLVKQDPFEKNLRKKLNFGHTIGHGIESLFLQKNKQISHGHAVAVGMLIESRISHQIAGLSMNELSRIAQVLSAYPKITFNEQEAHQMLGYCFHDKKNSNNQLRMVLLSSIGNCTTDNLVSKELLLDSLIQYSNNG